MGNSMVKTQVEEVLRHFEGTVQSLRSFLNSTTVDGLNAEVEGDIEYYSNLLFNLRRLEVFCQEGYEACNIIIQNEVFHKAAAERTLYRIYHQCVEEFFSPHNDVWYEDSRSAYTGKNSIKFRTAVPESLSGLIRSLEGGFQALREDLEYYETDYRTKMIQSK
ncbi:MAG: YpuI family protein [Bacillus sp. (in: firmicutes)]